MKKAIAALQQRWKIVETSSADGYLTIVENQTIDLVVVDFNMPQRDGLSLAVELRQRFTVMPIVLVTGNLQDHLIAEAKAQEKAASE